jgi:DNA-directed RNA polymerase specialized sigma24 family protein
MHMQKRVREAAKSLPPKCRRVLEMAKFQNIPLSDIARILAIDITTFKAHLRIRMSSQYPLPTS